jgi:hypothetical protein
MRLTGPVLGACLFRRQEVDAFECCCNQLAAEIGSMFVFVAVDHGPALQELDESNGEFLPTAFADEILKLDDSFFTSIDLDLAVGHFDSLAAPHILAEGAPMSESNTLFDRQK